MSESTKNLRPRVDSHTKDLNSIPHRTRVKMPGAVREHVLVIPGPASSRPVRDCLKGLATVPESVTQGVLQPPHIGHAYAFKFFKFPVDITGMVVCVSIDLSTPETAEGGLLEPQQS